MSKFMISLLLVFFFFNIKELQPQVIKSKTLAKPLKSFELGIRFLKLGNSYREGKKYDLALLNLDEGFKIIQRYHNVYWWAVAKEYYGYYYRDIGRTDLALECFINAKNAYDKIIMKPYPYSPEAMNIIINNIEKKIKFDSITNSERNILKRELNPLINRLISLVDTAIKAKEQEDSLIYPNTSPKFIFVANTSIYDTDFVYEEYYFKTKSFYHLDLILGAGYGSILIDGRVNIPPVNISMNYRASNNFETGIFYSYLTENYLGNQNLYSIFGISETFIFPFNYFDLSATAYLGCNSRSPFGSFSSKSYTYGVNAGFRYYLTSNLGIFLNAGYGLTFINTGIIIKI